MQPVRASVAKKVGELIGALHDLAIPSDAPINPYLTYRRPQSDWDALLERARRARKPWAEDLARLLPTVAALREIGADVPSDGLILCVCNLIPESVRTGRGGELVVVEWHFSGSLTPELELGYVLAGWMLRPELNVVGVKALVEGYRSRAGHVPELDLASFAVLISGSLNWTHAQICEAIDPETPDKGAFAEREAVDVLADPLTPSKLEQLLEVVRPAMAV